MALPAAMVLSGIPQDQFTGNLQTVFTQGSVLLRSPRSASVLQTQASSLPSTSSSSAGSSSTAHCFSAVDSSSVAPPSSATSTSGPSTSGLSTSGLSTSAPSTSAPSTSAPSTSAPSTSAPPVLGQSPAVLSTDSGLESGIASLSASSTATEISLDYYLTVINTIEEKFQDMQYPNNEPDNSEVSVLFNGRNILDLGANLRSNWPLQPAALPDGVDHFFENRSQLSRVAGAEIPPHRVHVCEDPECGFVEPLYY